MKVSIYGLAHPLTGEIRYVGLARDPKSRLRQHRCHPHTLHLKNWVRSIQRDDLEPRMLIFEVCDESICGDREKLWIQKFIKLGDRLVNITNGGEIGCSVVYNEERRRIAAEKFAQTKLLYPDKFIWTEEKKTAQSKRLMGRPAHPSAAENMRKWNKSRTGKPLSMETVEKMRIRSTGRRHSPEGRARMSEAQKQARRNPNRKVQTKFRDRVPYSVGGHHLGETYRAMMRRCYYEKDKQYKTFGARGITVCDEWRNRPESFLKWAEQSKPNGFHLCLRRGCTDYSVHNCLWVDPKESNRKVARLNAEQIPEIVDLINSGWSMKAIGDKFGVSKTTINDIRRGKSWTDISGVMQYEQQ